MRRVLLLPLCAAVMGLPTALWPTHPASEIAYSVGELGIVVFAWLAVVRTAGRFRLTQGLIAATLTVWLLGDLTYSALVTWGPPIGDVSAAEPLWLVGYFTLGAGVISWASLRAPGRLREAALDAMALTTVFAALTWQDVVLPMLGREEQLWVALIRAFYPVGDVILFAAGAVLMFAPGGRRKSLGLLFTALAVTLMVDVVIACIDSFSLDFNPDRLSALLLVANAMFTAALWHPDAIRADTASTGHRRLHPARVAFLGAALLALPAAGVLHSSASVISSIGTLLAMATLATIILVRFLFLVRQQEAASAELAYIASHDELTGLYNRQAAYGLIEERLATGCDVWLHYVDLDGFKQVNDGSGHAAGDYVLSEVARRFQDVTRVEDVVARLGGDEFIVATSRPAAATLAARLLDSLAEPLVLNGERFRIGASIGVAGTENGERSLDELVRMADESMYEDKRSRRAKHLSAGDGTADGDDVTAGEPVDSGTGAR